MFSYVSVTKLKSFMFPQFQSNLFLEEKMSPSFPRTDTKNESTWNFIMAWMASLSHSSDCRIESCWAWSRLSNALTDSLIWPSSWRLFLFRDFCCGTFSWPGIAPSQFSTTAKSLNASSLSRLSDFVFFLFSSNWVCLTNFRRTFCQSTQEIHP